MHKFASKGENTMEVKIELTSDKGGEETRQLLFGRWSLRKEEDFKETVSYFHQIITTSSSMQNKERDCVCVCACV